MTYRSFVTPLMAALTLASLGCHARLSDADRAAWEQSVAEVCKCQKMECSKPFGTENPPQLAHPFDTYGKDDRAFIEAQMQKAQACFDARLRDSEAKNKLK
jgi:hypothetical protein